MITNTEEVCLLGNWTHDISINDKNLEHQLLIQDPYDSVWLKIIAILSYFIGLVSSVIMLSFINYETGHHGNFWTVINQLLSNMYAMVSKKIIILYIQQVGIILLWSKGPSLYYVRVFWAFFEPPTHLRKDIFTT